MQRKFDFHSDPIGLPKNEEVCQISTTFDGIKQTSACFSQQKHWPFIYHLDVNCPHPVARRYLRVLKASLGPEWGKVIPSRIRIADNVTNFSFEWSDKPLEVLMVATAIRFIDEFADVVFMLPKDVTPENLLYEIQCAFHKINFKDRRVDHSFFSWKMLALGKKLNEDVFKGVTFQTLIDNANDSIFKTVDSYMR